MVKYANAASVRDKVEEIVRRRAECSSCSQRVSERTSKVKPRDGSFKVDLGQWEETAFVKTERRGIVSMADIVLTVMARRRLPICSHMPLSVITLIE